MQVMTSEVWNAMSKRERNTFVSLMAECPGDTPFLAGDTFNTESETGCVVITTPDEYGQFDAYDSEGVRCAFHVAMITDYVTA